MWDVIHKRALLIKEPNEVKVLRYVRDVGQISRIEIAKECNLSKASVSDLVARLLDAGFLEEVGKGGSSDKGGRKRILLRFHRLAGMVAGIDIRRDHAIVALTDLNASILESLRVNYPVGSKPEEVFTLLVSGFHQLIKKASNPKAPRLVGIGIGIPGVIDYDANSLVLADTMKGWQGCDIGGMFERQFGVSTFVENDVKTRTLGEYLFGAAKGCTDSIYLWIGSGIGAGIIINGKLHRGFTSSAGEVGYNELGSFLRDRDRYPILYRSQQDFGDILSDGNIIQSYNNGQHNGHQTVSTVEEIVQLSVQGDQHAAQTIEEATSLLSVVCIGLINTLNPEVIILGGGMIHAHESILKTVQSKIRADILSVPAEAVRIEAARLVEDGTIRGAVGLVLYELFEPIHSASFRKKMTLRSA